MVNSSPFLDTDVDRNVKGGFTQADDALHCSGFADTTDALPPCLRDTDFARTADNGDSLTPVASAIARAIEPTTSEYDSKRRMPEEESSKVVSVDREQSFFCSVPLEKVKDVLKKFGLPKEEDRMQNGKNTIMSRKLLCLYCERSFVTANLRQKHVERCHSIKQIRRVSSRRFQNQQQIASAICIYCEKQDSAERSLKQLFHHLVSEHPNKYFGCLPCEDRFCNATALQNHNTNFHGISNNKTRLNGLKSESSGRLSQNSDNPNSIEAQNLIRTRRNRMKLKESLNESGNKKIARLPPSNERKLMQPQKVNLQKSKNINTRELRNKKITVKSTKAGIKRNTRLQNKLIEIKHASRRRTKATKAEPIVDTKASEKSTNSINPYPEFDSFFRVKKITDHSIDNLRISTLTFDDVFDKAFFNRIKCNIQENLLNHIDGKLFKNEESETRISNFEKITTVHQQDFQATSQAENYGCEVSLNAATPVVALITSSQFGEDPESQIEYGSKASKRKTQTRKDEVNYKYFTRRKYQASILEYKENRDLSKLDMWTQLVVKERQQKIDNDKKTAKEMLDYTKCQEYQAKLQKDELNRILDKRGPFEDLRQEATKKAALEKVGPIESFSDVSEILNDILEKIAHSDRSRDSVVMEAEEKKVEIPGYLNLRRSSSSPGEDEIDRSDRITLICSSQETENFDAPNATLRNKKEMVELTGEWARARIYICAACGMKVLNMKQLIEHKSLYHQNVWCQHFEFVGNQSELYKHLSIPGLGKVGIIEDGSDSGVWKKSEARMCSKCEKQCNTLVDLHRHILECGGDWSWMLARKKCKYRPFGAKSRRKRRGLVKRNFNPERKLEKRKYKKRFEGPRSKPSDAETIQRMLANLPAKRATRKVISLRDGLYRPRKTQAKNIQNGDLRANKIKCGKVVCKKKNLSGQKNKQTKDGSNLQSNLPKRKSLRNINKVLTSRILDTASTFKVKRKLKRLTRRAYKSKLNVTNLDDDTVVKEQLKSEVSPKTARKTKFKVDETDNKPNDVLQTVNTKPVRITKLNGTKVDLKSFFPVRKTRRTQLKSSDIEEAFKEESISDLTRPKSKRKLNETDKNHLPTSDSTTKAVLKTKKNKNQQTEINPAQQLLLEPFNNNQPAKKIKRRVRRQIFQMKKKKKSKPPITNIVQIDGSSQESKDTKSNFLSEENASQETHLRENLDDLDAMMPQLEKIVPVTPEKKDDLNEIPILSPINLNFKPGAVEESKQNGKIEANAIVVHSMTTKEEIDKNKEAQMVGVVSNEFKSDRNVEENKPNGLIKKPKLKLKKPSRGLNDCIAMLTNKLQQKSDVCRSISFSEEIINKDTREPQKEITAIEETVNIKTNITAKPILKESVLNIPILNVPVFNVPLLNEPVLNKTILKEFVLKKPILNVPVLNDTILNVPLSNKPVFGKIVLNEMDIVKEPAVLKEFQFNKKTGNEEIENKILTVPNIRSKKVEVNTELIEENLPKTLSKEPEIETKEIIRQTDESTNEIIPSNCINAETNENHESDMDMDDNMEVEEMNTNALIIENKILNAPYLSAATFNRVEVSPHLNYKIDYILNNIPSKPHTPELAVTKFDITPVKKAPKKRGKKTKVKITKEVSNTVEESTVENTFDEKSLEESLKNVLLLEKETDAAQNSAVDETENEMHKIVMSTNETFEDSEDDLPLAVVAKKVNNELKVGTNDTVCESPLEKELSQIPIICLDKEEEVEKAVVNIKLYNKVEVSAVKRKRKEVKKKSKNTNIDVEEDVIKDLSNSEVNITNQIDDGDVNMDPSSDSLQINLVEQLQADLERNIHDDLAQNLIDLEQSRLGLTASTIEEVIESFATEPTHRRRSRLKNLRNLSLISTATEYIIEELPEPVVISNEETTSSLFAPKSRRRKRRNGARKRSKAKSLPNSFNFESESNSFVQVESNNDFEEAKFDENAVDGSCKVVNINNGAKEQSKTDTLMNATSFEDCLIEKAISTIISVGDVSDKNDLLVIQQSGTNSSNISEKTKKRKNGKRKQSKNEILLNESVLIDNSLNDSVISESLGNNEEEIKEISVITEASESINNSTLSTKSRTCSKQISSTDDINFVVDTIDESKNEEDISKPNEDLIESEETSLVNSTKDEDTSITSFGTDLNTKETSLEDLTNIDHVSKNPNKKSTRIKRAKRRNVKANELNENLIANDETVSNEEISSPLKTNIKFKIRFASKKTKNPSSDNEDPAYCDICNKVFKRADNLVKHKRTLTHIAKLSEIEAKEAALKNKMEDKIEEDTINLTDILQTEMNSTGNFANLKSNDTLKLADIINDVLNKPVSDDSNCNNFANMILQSTVDLPQTEMRRCKSLGERKSFELDLNFSSKTNSSDFFMSKTDTILEKQISLLENIIENHSSINYVDDISISSIDNQMSPLSKRDDSNQIEPKYGEENFLKPTQYEEISEESTNVRNHFDEQKSRKTLNRDEELFLECCSLLKSGSEISNYSKTSNKKSINGMHMDFKSVDEPEWLEKKFLSNQRQLNEASNGFLSDDSPIPTPLGDSFVDDASNSNTISSSWQTSSNILDGKGKNGEILSTSFIFDEIIEEESFVRKEDTMKAVHDADKLVEEEEEKGKNEDVSNGNGLRKKVMSKFGGLMARVIKNKFNAITKTSKDRPNEDDDVVIQKPVEDGNNGCSSPTGDNKKMLTKGAMKVFEGLKVSIPTEELNMTEVLNCSPTSKRLEIEADKEVNKKEPVPVIFKTKVTKKKVSKPKLQLFKNKIKLKLPKKKEPKRTKSIGLNSANKTFDVYDFEETQDNLDSSLSLYRSFRNNPDKKQSDELNLEAQSESSTSSSTSSKKVQNITKKKCMIMGRIFKNAIKSKVDEDIRDIPVIDNSKLVENYVLNCSNSTLDENKQKMSVDEMDRLFDKLLSNQEEPLKKVQEESPAPPISNVENKKKKIVKLTKAKRRNRANSESTDEEFDINKTLKKRRKRQNPKNSDDVINLEQELKECIGVASRKSQRKCTSGKQNVLVEFWSSDESVSEAVLQPVVPQSQPEPPIQVCTVNDVELKVAAPAPASPVLEQIIEATIKAIEEPPIKKHSRTKSSKYKNSAKKVVGDTVLTSSTIQAADATETLSTNRRKRAAADTLYYWSSSSEDEFQDMIEVKPIRDEVDDDDRPIQHGWIVGDSPKKLVTMLAQAKGKKTDSECVKEQGKKRTASSLS